MKKNRVLVAVLMVGFSASMSIAQTPSRLTQQDCRLFFPSAKSSEYTRTLASGILYTEAWEQGSWGPPEEFYGYVFLKSLQYKGKTINLLAGVTRKGEIIGVCVRGIDGVDENFLAQFKGKTLKDSFDLVQKPEDLLSVPIKIKPMQGNLALSENIAQGVKDIAQSADKVIN